MNCRQNFINLRYRFVFYEYKLGNVCLIGLNKVIINNQMIGDCNDDDDK